MFLDTILQQSSLYFSHRLAGRKNSFIILVEIYCSMKSILSTSLKELAGTLSLPFRLCALFCQFMIIFLLRKKKKKPSLISLCWLYQKVNGGHTCTMLYREYLVKPNRCQTHKVNKIHRLCFPH